MARILYLAQLLTQDGINLNGSNLVETLGENHDIQVSGMVRADDDPLLAGRFAPFLVSASDLGAFDVIVMEGGWQAWGPDQARLPREMASTFVRDGGQLIVADLARNEARTHRETLLPASDLLRAVPKYDSQLGLAYLHDDLASDADRYGFWFYRNEMVVSDWLAPALEGIDRLLVEHPIYLLPVGGIAASGNKTTEVLASDNFVERGVRAPWACAAEVGLGHVVVIGGIVTPNPLTERNPANATWISNLVSLTLERTNKKNQWIKPLPARSADIGALAVARESRTLEKKSSFLVSVDPGKPDIPTREVQRWVGKSIVGLANVDGGHLFIGIADDHTPLGLEADFATLKGNDKHDLFEQKLSRYIKDNIEPWPSLNLKTEWLVIEGKDVLAVAVPAANEPVHLKESKGEVFYMRNMSSTDALTGKALADWLRGPRWR